jgi:hypothetical protein
MSGIPLISGGGTNYANAKYATDTQTKANANDCDNSSNCAINRPQTQGDGTANSPTNLQISGFNEEREDVDDSDGVGGGEIGEIGLGILRFNVNVECPEDFTCPSPQDFQYEVDASATPEGSVTTIPSQFSGSDSTLVLLLLNHLLDSRDGDAYRLYHSTDCSTYPSRLCTTSDCNGGLPRCFGT